MADLSVCNECGGVDGDHRDTCPWEAPFIAKRAKEAADKRDRELLARLRAHPDKERLCSFVFGSTLGPGNGPGIRDAADQLLRLLRGTNV